MAKKISSRDIFAEEDIFKAVKTSAKETIEMMKALKKEVEGTASQLKKGFGAKPSMDSSKNLEKIVKVSKQANTLKKEAIQIDKLHSQAIQQEAKATQELEKIEQQKIKTSQQQQRLDVQNRKEKERLQKIQERQKKTLADESNAYKRLVKETRNAKNESKRLGAELLLLEKAGKKNSAEYRRLSQSYNQMASSAKKGDKALKKLDKSVGDNFRNVGNYKGAIQGLIGTLGTLGAGVGIGQIFRNVTGIMIDFDQSQADLSAISGKTKGELAGLTAQAKELGATTQFSATQITEMQIELAKLGFTSDQILDSTKAVSNFASATGTDMASASKVAGSALRAFGLEAREMDRVVSVLGVATTKSALSFSDYETAMSQVAPVSKAFGFSIEDTTTLLAQLKNAGFDASKGAIATKNILLNLADANGKLAKEIGRPVTSLDDMAVAFGELEAKGIDLAKALDLTDKRSVSAFKVFMENADGMVDFRDSITNVSAELQDMADKKLDSVQGQLTLLSSAWEGWILGVDDSTGASQKLKDMIGFLAENLDTIMNTLVTALDIWVKYQLIVRSSALATKLFNSSIIQTARQTKGMKAIITGLGGAFNKLGQAIKNNIVGLALFALVELYSELTRVSGMLEKIEENHDALADASIKIEQNLRKETKAVDKLFDALKETNSESKEREKIINQINRTYGTTLKNLEDEEAFSKQINENYKNIISTLKEKAKIERVRTMYELSQRQLGEAEIAMKKADRAYDKFFANRGKAGLVLDLISQGMGYGAVSSWASGKSKLSDAVTATSEIYDDALAIANQYEADFLAMEASMISNGVSVSGLPLGTGGSGGGSGNAGKEFNEHLNEIKQFNRKYFEIQRDRRKIDEKEREREAMDVISGEKMNEIKRATETGEARVEAVEEMLKKEFELRKNFRREELRVELAEEYTDIKESMDEQWALIKEDYLKKLKIAKDFDKAKGDTNKTETKKIKAEFVTRQAQFRSSVKDEWADYKLLTKKKKEILESEFKDLNETLDSEIDSYNDDINNALEKYADAQVKEIKAVNDAIVASDTKALERRKKIWQTANDMVQLSSQIFTEASNKKIQQIEKEMEMAEKQYDLFKELAVNGNIDAQQSLAEQQKIINEANKKKLEEEKKQQRLRLAESVFNTYNSKIQAGTKPVSAVAETIRDTSVLLQFIQSIPAFLEGTEDTGKHGEGVDGKGGFHALLHPNERVIPKTLNEQIGNLSNEELTRIAVNYQNGVAVSGASQSASALDLALVVNELNDIKETIKNKPETNIELGEITSSMMEVVKSVKKGNSITYNRYKIKK